MRANIEQISDHLQHQNAGNQAHQQPCPDGSHGSGIRYPTLRTFSMYSCPNFRRNA